MTTRQRFFGCLLSIFAAMLSGCGSPPPPASPGTVGLEVPQRSEPWSTGYADGKAITSTHYRVYTTITQPGRQELLAGFLEASLGNACRLTALDQPPAGPMVVYMLGTRREWSALTDSKFGRYSAPSLMIENGAYTVEGITVCWDIGRTATFSVAAHEGMHQLLHHAFQSRLPLWAEEGLATTAEAFIAQDRRVRFRPDRNLARLSDLRKGIVHEHWLDLRTLLSAGTLQIAPKGQTATLSYYGQLYALMHMLRNHPTCRRKFRAMLSDARSGRLDQHVPARAKHLRGLRWHAAVGVPLFRHYIAEDLDAFEADFRSYARNLVRLQH